MKNLLPYKFYIEKKVIERDIKIKRNQIRQIIQLVDKSPKDISMEQWINIIENETY